VKTFGDQLDDGKNQNIFTIYIYIIIKIKIKKKTISPHSYKENWWPIASWNKSKDFDEKTKVHQFFCLLLAS
jgi:hypothetical protein